MIINENGLIPSYESTIKSELENELKRLYGANFYIKENGVLDSLIKTMTEIELSFQDNVERIITLLNPETVDGRWQDALYERIGVKRLDATKTIFSLCVISDGECSVKSGEIRLESSLKGNIFTNVSEFTTNKTGETFVDFESADYGKTELQEGETFKIISAPKAITAVNSSSVRDIKTGSEKETDEEFRSRFRQSKAINSKSTHFANLANLNKHVENDKYLRIIDKKYDNNYSPMEVKVIAKHNTTDYLFAKAVLDTVGAGVKLIGNTEVYLNDLSGERVKVCFQNAAEIPMDVRINLTFQEGVYTEEVKTQIKNNILKYVQEKIFGLGTVVYATELIIPTINTDGVKSVSHAEIKRKDQGEYRNIVDLAIDEYPHFNEADITITEDT